MSRIYGPIKMRQFKKITPITLRKKRGKAKNFKFNHIALVDLQEIHEVLQKVVRTSINKSSELLNLDSENTVLNCLHQKMIPNKKNFLITSLFFS